MTKLKQVIAYFEDAIRESDEIIAEINFCPMCGRRLS